LWKDSSKVRLIWTGQGIKMIDRILIKELKKSWKLFSWGLRMRNVFVGNRHREKYVEGMNAYESYTVHNKDFQEEHITRVWCGHERQHL